MELQRVKIGTVIGMNVGVQDLTRPVEFVGEVVAVRTEYGYSDRTGQPTNTRGTMETLYKTEDGRYVVYVQKWSHWQGEPNTYRLIEVTPADLDVGGRFEALGREAGLGRPLTLDEALAAD